MVTSLFQAISFFQKRGEKIAFVVIKDIFCFSTIASILLRICKKAKYEILFCGKSPRPWPCFEQKEETRYRVRPKADRDVKIFLRCKKYACTCAGTNSESRNNTIYTYKKILMRNINGVANIRIE